MTSIIQSPLRYIAARNFVDNYSPAASTNHLYVGIAGTTPWTNESVPPTPVDTVAERKAVFDDLLGAHKVANNDVSLVVPRINWTSGAEFFVADNTSATPFSQNTYVMTSSFRVYLCIGKDTSGATYANPPLTVTEPTGAGASIITSDGYTWKFLYDLSTYNVATMLSQTWLPVNYGVSQTTLQAASGDVQAYNTLGAKYVMIRARIQDIDLNTGITFRKVVVIENPIEVTSGLKAVATNYTTPSGTGAQFVQYSGNSIYQDNRIPVTRTFRQFEEIKVIVEF